ncbi:MAG: indolepyruvate ferredoxin oxidoreductase subunit alpha [Geobacteraceae bacterium]|nr:indolepyruvate ferredoxin oxidoreductase subunit alpha [Geobacteraceae bacterium]
MNIDSIHTGIGDGNEAVAWGAIDAGVNFVSHYPGAPVSRVASAFHDNSGIVFNHSLNEHIAALAALGASLCGARSLVVMKHVGLNIAADPLNYAGAVKISGGMVIVVGTDPGARSSTGEEDVHWYAPQFNFPLLEPTTVQGVYDAIIHAFDISEQTQTPVLLFVPGRIAYQSSLVSRSTMPSPPKHFNFINDKQKLINVGIKAVNNHRAQVHRLTEFALIPARHTLEFSHSADYGIITRGATFTVTCEAIEELQLADKVHLLNIEQTFPLHTSTLLAFVSGKKKLVIIEDQDGFLETIIKREFFGMFSGQLVGKEVFPAWGEISYAQVSDFLASEFDCQKTAPPPLLPDLPVPERPGACCEGCPHRPTLFALKQSMQAGDGIIGGDIGCSSLPPHRTDWLLCMNAGIGVSQGIAQMLPNQPLISTGGDGSLFHGGLLSLQSAVENGINLIHVILDNRSIAMTGHQNSPTSSSHFDMTGMLRSIGVKHIFEVDAFAPSLTMLAIKKAQSLNGVKVIRVVGECALQSEESLSARRQRITLKINPMRCGDCNICYVDFQCPAIVKAAPSGFSIVSQRCRRCGACLDICPNNAILATRYAASLVSRLLGLRKNIRRLSFQLRHR